MKRYGETKFFYLVVVLFVNATLLVDMARNIAIVFVPGLSDYVEMIRNVLYVGCTLYLVYLFVANGMLKRDLFILMGIAATFLISLIIKVQIIKIMKVGSMLFISRVLTGFFLLSHVDDFEKLAKAQVKLLIPVIIYAIFALFRVRSNYMTMSYNLFPAALFYLFYGFHKKKTVIALGGIFCLAIATIYGSRGALVGAVGAVLLYVAVTWTRRQRKLKPFEIVLLIVLLLGVGYTIVFWNEILLKLYARFPNSRTLRLLIDGTFSDTNSRDKLYGVMRAAIKEEMLIPHGVFADRFVIAESRGQKPSCYTYPHNLVLEVIYQYGLILGGILLLVLFWHIIRYIIRGKQIDKAQLAISIPYIAIGGVQLMVSSSYLNSFIGGIALGIIMNVYNQPERLHPMSKSLKPYGPTNNAEGLTNTE